MLTVSIVVTAGSVLLFAVAVFRQRQTRVRRVLVEQVHQHLQRATLLKNQTLGMIEALGEYQRCFENRIAQNPKDIRAKAVLGMVKKSAGLAGNIVGALAVTSEDMRTVSDIAVVRAPLPAEIAKFETILGRCEKQVSSLQQIEREVGMLRDELT